VTPVTATAQGRCEKQERGEQLDEELDPPRQQDAVCQENYMRGNEESTPAQKYLEKFQKCLRAERGEQLDEELEPPRNQDALCQENYMTGIEESTPPPTRVSGEIPETSKR
jgi:hypothetical protein